MVEPYTYKKKRKEFEKPVIFEDSEVKPLGGCLSERDLPPNAKNSLKEQYIKKNPAYVTLDNIPLLSTHEVNTERLVTQSKNMKHQEGG